MRAAPSSCLAACFCLVAAAFGSPAPASPAGQDQRWCPGQSWNEEAWGRNEDRTHCHRVDERKRDPEGDRTPDEGLGEETPRTYPDGEYPPDYDWSERYGDDHGHGH